MSYYNKPFSPDIIAGFIRSFFRIFLAVFSVLLTFLIFIPLDSLLPSSLKGRNRSNFQKSLMSLLLKIFGAKIIRSGLKPGNNIFMVSNHLGVMDVFSIMAETGGRLIAKDSLRRIPLFGYFMEKFGVIFIKRDSLTDMHRVVTEITQAYKQGDSIAFFPEGTTSRGEGIRQFHGALFMPAVQTKAPVYYGTIRFIVPSHRWPVASLSVCQVGGANFIKHLILLAFIPRIEVHISYGPKPIFTENRKQLVRDLEQHMVRHFVPMEQLDEEDLKLYSTPVAKESQSMKARPFLSWED